MKLVFNVVHVPCPEEYEMGASTNYEAFEVDVPDSVIPQRLLAVAKNIPRRDSSWVTNIAIMH